MPETIHGSMVVEPWLGEAEEQLGGPQKKILLSPIGLDISP